MAADVAFVLDASGSIGQPNFQRAVDFITSLVLSLGSDSRVALLTFSDSVSVRFRLGDFRDRTSLLDAVSLYYTSVVRPQ